MHILQGRAIIGRWRVATMRRVKAKPGDIERAKAANPLIEDFGCNDPVFIAGHTGGVIQWDETGDWSIRGSTLRGRWRTDNQGGEK
jgi:hypothetical protein